MDITSIPPTVFIAFGVITAALLTGIFSIVNMVSDKENKVSEFRLAWIDGLRNEIAEYSAAAQELSRAYKPEKFSPEDIFKETKSAYAKASENLTKIQLRLNSEHIKKNPNSPEALLMSAVSKARTFRSKEFKEVLDCCEEIRDAAAPLLKSTWNSVKLGEPAYRWFRSIAIAIVTLGFIVIMGSGAYIGTSMYKAKEQRTQKEMMLRFIEAERNLKKPIEKNNESPNL